MKAILFLLFSLSAQAAVVFTTGETRFIDGVPVSILNVTNVAGDDFDAPTELVASVGIVDGDLYHILFSYNGTWTQPNSFGSFPQPLLTDYINLRNHSGHQTQDGFALVPAKVADRFIEEFSGGRYLPVVDNSDMEGEIRLGGPCDITRNWGAVPEPSTALLLSLSGLLLLRRKI